MPLIEGIVAAAATAYGEYKKRREKDKAKKEASQEEYTQKIIDKKQYEREISLLKERQSLAKLTQTGIANTGIPKEYLIAGGVALVVLFMVIRK